MVKLRGKKREGFWLENHGKVFEENRFLNFKISFEERKELWSNRFLNFKISFEERKEQRKHIFQSNFLKSHNIAPAYLLEAISLLTKAIDNIFWLSARPQSRQSVSSIITMIYKIFLIVFHFVTFLFFSRNCKRLHSSFCSLAV